MAQLFFKYGTMNSGKSIDILKTAHNYEEQGKRCLLFTSAIDNRTKVGEISSRIGIHHDAIPVYDETNLFAITKEHHHDIDIDCVLVDEAQFLKKHHIIELTHIVDTLDIPVMTWGLKNDFQNHLFEGSQNLLIYADKIEEIKTVCWFCNKKATMNIRLVDGHPVYEGESIQIGGNESYVSVCRHHYHHPCTDGDN